MLRRLFKRLPRIFQEPSDSMVMRLPVRPELASNQGVRFSSCHHIPCTLPVLPDFLAETVFFFRLNTRETTSTFVSMFHEDT